MLTSLLTSVAIHQPDIIAQPSLVRQLGDIHVLRGIVSQRLLVKLVRVFQHCSRVGVDLRRVLKCIAPSV
jgi:hypothetical protein